MSRSPGLTGDHGMGLCRIRAGGRGAGTSAGDVARVGEVSGSERVVMFDIDGGLADLSAFTHLLSGESEGSRRQAWQRFFDQVGQAAVIEPGRDLVEAVAGLGLVVVYSTTRPVSCAEQTRRWLGDNGFPSGRALLCRSRHDVRPAVEVKVGHCRAVGQWLSAFVDDEPDTVDALRSGGVRAHSFDELSGLRVRELDTMLAAQGGDGALRRQRQRATPHHRQGRVAQRSP